MDMIQKLLQKINWISFWEEQINAIPYFILGLIISVWVIPYFTVRKIEKRNFRYINTKISFMVFELCDFLSKVPQELKQEGESIGIFIAEKKEFVALLHPNLLNKLTMAEFELKVLKLSELDKSKQFEIVTQEYKRLTILRNTLEKLVGFHSQHIINQISNEISEICYEIRKFEDMYSMNLTHRELLKEETGRYGILQLRNVYIKSTNLVSTLIEKNKFELG